jgi:sigma-B regulation protein RsbU (phosphoserine phosphatase)
MLLRLNDALAADNPYTMFVTLLQGCFDPASGRLTFCSAGHPAPLLRRTSGNTEVLQTPSGRLLGIPGGSLHLEDVDIFLSPGETFILYTDGFTEAHAPNQAGMFEVKRLCETLGSPELAAAPLKNSADAARSAVQRFAAGREQQDDQTLLLLRRVT